MELDTVLVNIHLPVFNPLRYAVGTPQVLSVTDNGGGMIGAVLYFINGSNVNYEAITTPNSNKP